MTSKEALWKLKCSIVKNNLRKEFETIEKDLDVLHELKFPYDEVDRDDYVLTTLANWNEYLGELEYSITLRKWNGNYITHKVGKVDFKFKEYEEAFHCYSKSKMTIDEVIKIVDGVEKVVDK